MDINGDGFNDNMDTTDTGNSRQLYDDEGNKGLSDNDEALFDPGVTTCISSNSTAAGK